MKIFYSEIFLIFLTNTSMRIPTFYINDQSKDVISSDKSQLFLKLFAFPKFFKNFLISLEVGICLHSLNDLLFYITNLALTFRF